MSNRVIVVTADLDDPKHGEVNVLDSPLKATRMIESLLESGLARERIRVFSGDEMGMEVAHRPIVELVAGNGAGPFDAGALPEATPVEKAEVARSSSRDKAEAQIEASATPFIRNGVRFSTQFRPA